MYILRRKMVSWLGQWSRSIWVFYVLVAELAIATLTSCAMAFRTWIYFWLSGSLNLTGVPMVSAWKSNSTFIPKIQACGVFIHDLEKSPFSGHPSWLPIFTISKNVLIATLAPRSIKCWVMPTNICELLCKALTKFILVPILAVRNSKVWQQTQLRKQC